MLRSSRQIWWFVILYLASLASQKIAFAEDESELRAYFGQLRAHGLFQIAEEYALDRLSRMETTDLQKAVLSIELSRIFASHATEAKSLRESEELWKRAEQLLQDVPADAESPCWWGVISRRATLKCDRALGDFWRHQLEPDSSRYRQAALESTRQALESLRAAAAEFESRIKSSTDRPKLPGRTPPRTASGVQVPKLKPTSLERKELVDELQHFEMRLSMNLAALEPQEADRVAALLEADRIAGQLSKRVNSTYVWSARLAHAECQRRLGASEKASVYTKSLRTDNLQPAIVDAIEAELARCELARHRPDLALQGLLNYGKSRDPMPSELRFIMVESLLDSLHTATERKDSALMDELWKQAQSQRLLTTGAWRVYADAMLSRVEEQRKYGVDIAALVRAGRTATEARDWPAAISAYDKSVTAADQTQRADLVAEFLYIKGSIEVEAQLWPAALATLQQFVDRFPAEPQAAEAHLLSTWVAMKQVDGQPTAENRSTALALLHEHLRKFPGSKTCHEVNWYLATEAIRSQDWSQAIESLVSIPHDHPRGLPSAVRIPGCLEQALLYCQPNERAAWQTRTEQLLSRQLMLWPGPPAGWTLDQSRIGWHWAKLMLQLNPPNYDDAEQILIQIRQSREIAARELARDMTPLPAEWDQLLTAVAQLRVISLAGTEKMGEAEALFNSAFTTKPDDLLVLLSGLSELSRGLDDRARNDLGRIQLAAARRLSQQRAELPEKTREQADRCLAEAYVATGDLPEAIELYEAMLRKHPRDMSLLQTTASRCLDRGHPENLDRAKEIYRQLESMERAGSDSWLRHRLAIARITFRQGEVEECQKLVQVTRILYPKLGGDDLKSQYDHLAAEAAIDSAKPR